MLQLVNLGPWRPLQSITDLSGYQRKKHQGNTESRSVCVFGSTLFYSNGVRSKRQHSVVVITQTDFEYRLSLSLQQFGASLGLLMVLEGSAVVRMGHAEAHG